MLTPRPWVTKLSAAGSAAIIAAAGLVLDAAHAAPACQPVPPVVRDIDLPRFYADTEGSVVDPKLAAAHKKAVEPLTHFLREVVSNADKSWRRSKVDAQREVAQCGLIWLETWAKGDAWLGQMQSRQAEYQRKWDLAGVALAYIKLKRYATAEQRAVIEPWLMRFADVCRQFFNDPGRKRNNHWYWLGLAAGATAIATGSDKHWALAREVMADAARDIAADGTLPHELERKSRALHYHAFAVMPLVVLAELAETKGEDFYKLNDGALHRLARITIDGLGNPQLFQKRVGEVQEEPVRPGAGWSQLYAQHFPDRLKAPLADAPDGHRWLGGDALILKQALATAAK